VSLETGVVEIAKVALVAPPETVTDAGTVALRLVEERLTTNPPVGAGPLMVTVPAEPVPPMTEAGLRLNELTVGAETVRVVVTLALP
jgi:hypothetical protein